MPSAVASCLVQLPSSAFIIRELTEDSFLFFSTLLPPTSTLFPYTTLFRSYAMVCSQSLIRLNSPLESMPFSVKVRSEEHTSELQSLRQLVCRLLLEKKNTNTTPITQHVDHHQPHDRMRSSICRPPETSRHP